MSIQHAPYGEKLCYPYLTNDKGNCNAEGR